MCLILFAWQAHPRYPLVIAANRDEFHARPTEDAAFWADQPDLLAGRDSQAGGTWMGISRFGRFAAVTNYREPSAPEPPLDYSRGHLVTDFVLSDQAPSEHARQVMDRGYNYRGFNLLLGDTKALFYASNRAEEPVAVEPGIHGLSNHLLDTDWPKVVAGREQLQVLLQQNTLECEPLFELMTNRTLTPGEMPRTEEASDLPEQLMRHNFIVSPKYGTRSSTILLIDRDSNVRFAERQYAPSGVATSTRENEFRVRHASARENKI